MRIKKQWRKKRVVRYVVVYLKSDHIFIAANKYEAVLKSEIIYCPHHGNSTKGVVVNNVHTIFRAVFTEECHLSKPLLILILSFFVRGLMVICLAL